jgi:acetoin utilization deacetylase AcuC-like enzyme
MGSNRRQFLGALGLAAGVLLVGDDTKQKSKVERTTIDQITTDSRFVWSNTYDFSWAKKFPYSLITDNHPSPVEKYKLLKEKILGDLETEENFELVNPMSNEDLRLVHTAGYLNGLERLARSGFGLILNGDCPINEKILDFAKASCSGTYLAAKISLKKGKGMNLSGGFHHAFPDHEEGFCFLNDVAIAIKKLQKEKRIKKAMIIDCDVHHGNGNAYIFRDDPSVYTFDIFQEDNYPDEKIETDLGIAFDTGRVTVDDDLYLTTLGFNLRRSLETFKPDIVFYLNGADTLETDILGDFKLTPIGLEVRDEFIHEITTHLRIPLVSVLAGGYSPNVEDVVDSHYHCAKLTQS